MKNLIIPLSLVAGTLQASAFSFGENVETAKPLAVSSIAANHQDDTETYTITGNVADTSGRPVDFASVAILNASDSSFVAGGVTDADGRFAIPCKMQRAILKVSCVGYETLYKACTTGDAVAITLSETVNTLQGVTVKGQRKLFEMTGEGIVANIKGTALSEAGTADDVIAKMPSVYADGGKYSVYGKGEAQIYINGRKIVDYDELSRLSSKDIASVTIDNNPGAKYDATVKAVIHIKTVRRQGDGLSGSLSAMYRQAHRGSSEDGATLNWRKGGLDIFASAFYAVTQSYQKQRDNKATWKDGDTWKMHNSSTIRGRKPVSANTKLGFSYAFNARHSIGASYNMTYLPNSRAHFVQSQSVERNGQPDESFVYDTRLNSKSSPQHLANIYYRGNVGGWSIAVDNDLVKKKGRTIQHVAQTSSTDGSSSINSTSRADNVMAASKVVVSHSVGKGRVEAGGELIHTDSKQKYSNEQQIIAATDDHIKEDKYAGFIAGTMPLGKCEIRAGLRYEHTVSDYYEHGTWVAGQSRRYDNLFPNASVSFPVGRARFSVAYTAKTRRPTYHELSSNMQYDDVFTYEGGNPLLRPETTHDITLSASYRWVYMNVGYKHVSDAITSHIDFLEGSETPTSVMTNVNRPSVNMYSAALSLTPRFGLWSPRLTVSLMGQNLKTDYHGGRKKLDTPLLFAGLYNSFALPGGYILTADISGRTYGDVSIATLKPSWQTNLGASKNFGLWTVLLQATDIFHTARSSMIFYGTGLRHDKWNYPDTQAVKLTVSYRFNPTGSKYKGTGAGAEEKSRL